MSATIINGKEIAEQMQVELAEKVNAFRQEYGRAPGLAVILVGEDPASQVYVRNKHRACTKVGMYSEVLKLSAETTEEELFMHIDRYNADPCINGLLVQFPVPGHLSQQRIIERILPEKDVDGLSLENAGKLFAGGKGLVSCTPKGVIELIKRTGTEIAGKRAIVVGRSNLVGKPVAMLLLNENATVTICHSRTENLAEVTSQADILVAAVGKPGCIGAEHIKPGAVVIDVGTSRVEGKLKGDVAFEEAVEKAGYLTPVPGGVGPMTITMLLYNTLEAAEMQRQAK